MDLLKVGVFGSSRKKQEKRLPIHPDQLDWIPEDVLNHLYFEEGYGAAYDVSDELFDNKSAGIRSKSFLYNECDIALLAKPTIDDFLAMKDGMIHWGWPHCVQQRDITQAAIDKKLTLIAWEAMHKWSPRGDWQMHIFQQNNELAGYAGVLHAMAILGINGNYGPNRKAAVMSFGSVSRGAVRALQALGVQNITVFTQRHYAFVADQMAGVNYYNFDSDEHGNLITLRPNQSSLPLIDELARCDIIVNGILQDTEAPLLFVSDNDKSKLKKGCLIVDISCDEGMGFSFAKPTTFELPILKIDQVYYYGVDHTPSYLWNAASWEISNGVIPYLPIVMQGNKAWQKSETIRRAIEIHDGIILNPKIVSFQKR